jgi:hypothetical protein
MAQFADLLSEAVHRIRLCEYNKPISVIHDELGYALGRQGGTAIAYWRKGHVPKPADLEKLARELIRRSDLDRAWLQRFLQAAHYPYPENLLAALFPTEMDVHSIAMHTPPAPVSNLPFRAPHFQLIGRDSEQQELLARLADPSGPPILAVDGAGGMGKSALLYQVAVECRKRKLFEFIIWVEASAGAPGEVDALTLKRILLLVGRQLALADFADLQEDKLVEQLQMRLHTHRVLILLDSLEIAGEPQEGILAGLQPLLGISRVLVASRRRIIGDAFTIHLRGLDMTYYRQFVRQEARLRGLPLIDEAPEEELEQIYTATGGSPLAIKLVVGQLGFLPLEFVLDRLHDVTVLAEKNRRDEYTAMYSDLFLPTWSQLSEDAQRLLVAMSLFVPGLGGGLDAIRAVSELAARELFSALNELWRMSLLEVAEAERGSLRDKRYYLHTLTRNFVNLAINADDNRALQEERMRAALDFINYFISYATTHAHNSLLLTRELDNLTTSLRMVHELAQPDLLVIGAQVICPQLLEHGRSAEAIVHLERAETAARYEAAQRPLASILLQLGRALQKCGRTTEADQRLAEAHTLAPMLSDDTRHASGFQSLNKTMAVNLNRTACAVHS